MASKATTSLRRHRPSLVTTERLRNERGASLVIAMVLILVLGVTLSAVLAYSDAASRSSNVYRKQRVDRYAADAALEAGIDYLATQPNMGREPGYSSSDPPCVYNVPTDAGLMSVTCAADEGSGSGVPNETGLVPDQAILALGQRHNEVGPLNDTQCSILGFDAGTEGVERSIYFEPGGVRGVFQEDWFNFCNPKSRNFDQFKVGGKVVAAGQIAGRGQLVSSNILGPNGNTITGSIKARYGCTMSVSPPCTNPSNAEIADPGAGGTTTAWKHVPVDWSAVRTHPYYWNATTGQIGTIPANANQATWCSQGYTIIFQPGWYQDANVLNRWTSTSACKDTTIWLAPSVGADNIPLTDDDKTGAYYFGFTNTDAGPGCNLSSSQPHRWCIGGGGNDTTPRVVGGTPKGWNPLAFQGTTEVRDVTMVPTAVDSGISQSWDNGGGAARIGDGSVATYNATFCVFVCISSDRSIQVRDLAPKITATPDPKKLYITVAHREIGSGLGTPTFEIFDRDTSCGISGLTVPSYNTGGSNPNEPLQSARLRLNGSEEDAATAIAACLNSVDKINNMRILMKVTGNTFNTGSPKPQVFLDGFKVDLKSLAGASFPAPSGQGSAVSDCDKTKAGVQLIFGGDSHVYVPDGSLEACAGPYPESPGDHQQIALYGVPAPNPVGGNGLSTSNGGGGNSSLGGSGQAYIDRVDRIAEPDQPNASARSIRLNYSASNPCSSGPFFCNTDYQGQANVTMAGYTPPAGLRVARVDARIAYNQRSACVLGLCVGRSPAIKIGNCGAQNLDLGDSLRHQQINNVQGCFSSTELANGITASFISRWQVVRCGVPFFPSTWVDCTNIGGNSSSHYAELDGIELIITLEQDPSSTTKVVVPQSGCIVDYPNYWEGAGNADCALMKADSVLSTPPAIIDDIDIFDIIDIEENNWVGRASMQGTIYAPTAAIEYDDWSVAYPLAARGVVARHLRIKAYDTLDYAGPAIDTQIDNRRAAREVTMNVCERGPGRQPTTSNPLGGSTSNRECNASLGDRIMTKARVRFDYVSPTVWEPHVLWWTDQR